jgi:hypothetical protein
MPQNDCEIYPKEKSIHFTFMEDDWEEFMTGAKKHGFKTASSALRTLVWGKIDEYRKQAMTK